MSKNVVYDEERKQFALESNGGDGGDGLPIGTNKQVLGYVDGEAKAVKLGWIQFSDLNTVPNFNTGVVAGTTFNPDGSAMFYFQEINDAVGGLAKENTIPVYGSNGVLKVSDGASPNDAVSLQQYETLATTQKAGIMKQAVGVEDSDATELIDLRNSYNELLSNLRTAGIMY